MDNAIEIVGLRKRYGDFEAIRGVNLAVPRGTVLGLLGPNGSGKTTTVRVLATLLKPDAGEIRVAGLDVVRQAAQVRRKIGLAGQYAAVDERLTARENLQLIATLYHIGRKRAGRRVDELLSRFNLTDVAGKQVKTYSGGMRRRLDLAASLVADPPVLFLDEPTTGLDITNRMALWEMVKEQAARGATILLTTQYLEEADQLANQIVVIAKGQVIAEGTPDELKRKAGGQRLEVELQNTYDAREVAYLLERTGLAPATIDNDGYRVSVPADGGMDSVAAAVGALRSANIRVVDFTMRRPSMDDVFLSLTGHAAQESGESQAQPARRNGA